MGVNHLRRDAAIATSGVARGNTHKSPQSEQTMAGPNFRRPAETSATTSVPEVSSVNSFSDRSEKPGNSAPQPPKGAMNGARAGAKSGQEKTGTKRGNNHPVSGAAMY